MNQKSVLAAAFALFISLTDVAAQRCVLYMTHIDTNYADAGSANLSAYAIDTKTGALAAVNGSPFDAGACPVGIAVDPAGRFLCVADNVVGVIGGMGVYTFAIDAITGGLAAAKESPYSGPSPFCVAVDPAGRFLFVANSGSPGSVSVYAVEATSGRLAEIDGSPFPVESGSSAITVDPKGKHVYVANTRGNNVRAFTIDPDTGALDEVKGSPFAAGTGPTGITLDLAGKLLYVANNGSADISAFTIDPRTGALAEVRGSPFTGPSPFAVTVDPKARFLYVTNNLDDNVSVYRIDARTGALAAIRGSPFPTASIPKALAMDPVGNFLYVANNGSGKISVYTINSTTGALKETRGSPFGVGFDPYCVAIATLPGS
jgi:6-phosphogluconolactonase